MSVRLNNGKWQVDVYDPATKRPRYGGRYPNTRQGKRDADARELELRNELEGNGDDETVAQFAARWKQDFPMGQRGKREPTSWVTYLEKIKPFVAQFGSRPMRSIKRKEARSWAVGFPHHATAVRTMFADAIRDELLDHNPFSNLQLERSVGRANLTPIDYEGILRIGELAEEIAGPSFKALCLLAGLTALRESECFGVSEDDFDLPGHEVNVLWQYRSNVGDWARPKNHSVRRVVVPPPAVEAVKALLPRDLTGVPTRPPSDHPTNPTDGRPILLLTPRGKHFTARTHDYWWRQVRCRFGKPKMQFHELKHAAASYYLNELDMDPKHIINQLAHKDTELLWRLYGHPDEDASRAAFHRAFAGNVTALRDVSRVARRKQA